MSMNPKIDSPMAEMVAVMEAIRDRKGVDLSPLIEAMRDARPVVTVNVPPVAAGRVLKTKVTYLHFTFQTKLKSPGLRHTGCYWMPFITAGRQPSAHRTQSTDRDQTWQTVTYQLRC